MYCRSYIDSHARTKTHIKSEKPMTWMEVNAKYTEDEIDSLIQTGGLVEAFI